MKFDLISEDSRKAYYKSDKPIRFDSFGVRVEEPSKYVVISDAWSHVERLVFLFKLLDGFTEQDLANGVDGCIKINFFDIDGEITLLTDGGATSTIHPHEYYLNRLIEANTKNS